jgi:hypothetical protein
MLGDRPCRRPGGGSRRADEAEFDAARKAGIGFVGAHLRLHRLASSARATDLGGARFDAA